jgi:hypothetical protein
MKNNHNFNLKIWKFEIFCLRNSKFIFRKQKFLETSLSKRISVSLSRWSLLNTSLSLDFSHITLVGKLTQVGALQKVLFVEVSASVHSKAQFILQTFLILERFPIYMRLAHCAQLLLPQPANHIFETSVLSLERVCINRTSHPGITSTGVRNNHQKAKNKRTVLLRQHNQTFR